MSSPKETNPQKKRRQLVTDEHWTEEDEQAYQRRQLAIESEVDSVVKGTSTSSEAQALLRMLLQDDY